MKKLVTGILLLLLFAGKAFATNDSLLTVLNSTIRQSPAYDAGKIRTIDSLKKNLPATRTPLALFDHQQAIYEAYKVFNYDSAYTSAITLVRLAGEMHDDAHLAAAQLKLSFILLSAGLYKEAFDSLSSLSTRTVPTDLKSEYYALWGRYYFDLAGYANDHYHSVDYDIRGVGYLDSALAYYPPSSFEYGYYSGLKNYKQGKAAAAAVFFEKLLADPHLSYHQLALTASTLAGISLQEGNIDKAIDLLTRATIADIRSSTKETVAIFHLAELLYKKENIREAVLCIESAVANAEFYGARQRKMQASTILPLIEGERVNGIEAQKSLLLRYAVIVTLLVLALMLLGWIILKQVKKLKLAQQALTEANAKQQAINSQLAESNRRLEEVNDKLEDSNRIKEEYLGYFFNVDSEFYGKLDKIKSTIEQKLREKRYDDIKFFLNKIDARKEKEELLLSFDKIFLKLFPDFVEEVNVLLREGEQVLPKEGELLSTDLRIFALMRMGVTDPEKIGQILEYSVKTIYSYKSRLKHKAAIPGDEFEDRIMRVKRF